MAKSSNDKAEKTAESATSAPYVVLARKYRPSTFADLIGQEAMVRTLTNAFASGRIAQAYMLTGVRGVGKTTTARILARALNYETEDVHSPTIHMPKEGVHCAAIMQSRHMDVLEMDAASNTGIDDIREIIESVRYKPVAARTKVYIIDEVHMLSKAAFNGLLKTLEEPPEHVKFIFATTEIQKVPVTVLSRCQRFDLRRVPVELLVAHFAKIAQAEGVEVEEEALHLLARAAEGSVRDGLSILDQAIAHAEGGVVKAGDIRDMLGLADSGRVLDLLHHILKGQAGEALATHDALFADGAEAETLVAELAALTHAITRLKIAGAEAAPPALGEALRSQLQELAGRLSVPVLSRLWQMLLKGVEEVRSAPDRQAASEMLIIRLAHIADLPAPDELIRKLEQAAGANPAAPPLATSSQTGAAQPAPGRTINRQPEIHQADVAPSQPGSADGRPPARLESFEDIVACAGERRELMIKVELEDKVRLVRFEPQKLVINPLPHASKTLIKDLSEKLSEWTGDTWFVTTSDEPGLPPLSQRRREALAAEIAAARQHPMVQAALKLFPNAEIAAVRPLESAADGEAPQRQDDSPPPPSKEDKTDACG